MDTDRGRSVDRLVTFTDAVVAIAVTLLVLPLADITAAEGQAGLGALLLDRWPAFFGFALSFFVVARLWWSHHRLFEHVERWSGALVLLTMCWLFTIVLLPVATAVTTTFSVARGRLNPGAIAAYLGLLAVSSALLTVLSLVVLRHPELTDGDTDRALELVVGSVQATVGFTLAFVIGTAVPQVNYFALLVLVLTGRLDRLVLRRLRRGRAARAG